MVWAAISLLHRQLNGRSGSIGMVLILLYSNPKSQIEGCIKCNRVDGMNVTFCLPGYFSNGYFSPICARMLSINCMLASVSV
jgi:hypothetical protein